MAAAGLRLLKFPTPPRRKRQPEDSPAVAALLRNARLLEPYDPETIDVVAGIVERMIEAGLSDGFIPAAAVSHVSEFRS